MQTTGTVTVTAKFSSQKPGNHLRARQQALTRQTLVQPDGTSGFHGVGWANFLELTPDCGNPQLTHIPWVPAALAGAGCSVWPVLQAGGCSSALHTTPRISLRSEGLLSTSFLSSQPSCPSPLHPSLSSCSPHQRIRDQALGVGRVWCVQCSIQAWGGVSVPRPARGQECGDPVGGGQPTGLWLTRWPTLPTRVPGCSAAGPCPPARAHKPCAGRAGEGLLSSASGPARSRSWHR